MKKICILVGPPGSGKGTQAELLKDALPVKLIKTGTMLRREVSRKTDFGKKIKPMLDRGELIPPEVVNEMIFRRLSRATTDVIIDGYPRQIEQAIAFHEYVNHREIQVTLIEIKLEDKYILERITGRRTCTCGETFHVKYNPPKRKGVCDNCDEKLTVREDSKPVVVRNRIKVYKKQTEPVITYFRKLKNHLYFSVNGNQSIEGVTKDILKKLK